MSNNVAWPVSRNILTLCLEEAIAAHHLQALIRNGLLKSTRGINTVMPSINAFGEVGIAISYEAQLRSSGIKAASN